MNTLRCTFMFSFPSRLTDLAARLEDMLTSAVLFTCFTFWCVIQSVCFPAVTPLLLAYAFITFTYFLCSVAISSLLIIFTINIFS